MRYWMDEILLNEKYSCNFSIQTQTIHNINFHMFQESSDWYTVLIELSHIRILPILLPPMEIVKSTLQFQDGRPFRNLQYMSRILKRYPIFIWLSPEPLDEQQLANSYQTGIEFFHAKNEHDAREFLLSEISEDIILVSSYKYCPQAVSHFGNSCGVKRIYIYVCTDAENFAFPQSYRNMMIRSLEDMYQQIDNLASRKAKRENQKFVLINSEKIDKGIELISQYLNKLQHQNFNRPKEIDRFSRLASKFFQQKSHQKSIELFKRDYPSTELTYQGLEKIVNWYTRQSFFYKLLNAVLRGTTDPLALSHIAMIVQDLCRAIKEKSKRQKMLQKDFVVYRKTFLSKKQISMLQIGRNIIMGGFVSTTLSNSVLENFQGSAIIKINVSNNFSRKQKLYTYINDNIRQEEVLFLPNCVFEIKNVQKIKKIQRQVDDSLGLVFIEQQIVQVNMNFKGHILDFMQEMKPQRTKIDPSIFELGCENIKKLISTRLYEGLLKILNFSQQVESRSTLQISNN